MPSSAFINRYINAFCKILGFFLFLSTRLFAQNEIGTCGNQFLKKIIVVQRPDFADSINTKIELYTTYSKNGCDHLKGAKVSKAAAPIPVIFHIVLSQLEINMLGGVTGIEERIDSQMAVINRDFNGKNADQVLIPEPFKSRYANVGISFGLAHTDPLGNGTPGYDIIRTDSDGFSLIGGFGSGFGFSSAKYAASGGANSWDPYSYLNVWVIHAPSAITGLTVPASYTGISSGIPFSENGVVINFGAFGVKTADTQYYFFSNTSGRTLTHELGHMFEIWHTWGDNDGSCNQDDPISDIPPQTGPTYGCPAFPKFDQCSPSGNGIMFMNYMDYTDDTCKHLFTLGQANVMSTMTSFGQESYSLTQHPDLLLWPDRSDSFNSFQIYPNPVISYVLINFNKIPNDLKSIRIFSIVNAKVDQIVVDTTYPSGYYSFDMSNLPSGVYFIKVIFSKSCYTQKIVKI